MAQSPARPSSNGRASAWQVFLAFLALGCTSFGGPTAHLGYFHTEFVSRRKWLSDEEFGDIVAVSQFLPGPASSQAGFGIGLARAGIPGAIAAFIGFTLPSVLLMVGIAYGASLFTGGIADGVIAGLKIVAVAIVASAVWGMARTFTPDLGRVIIALCAAVCVFFLTGIPGQLTALLVGVIGGVLCCRSVSDRGEGSVSLRVSRRLGGVALTAGIALLVGLPVASWLFTSEVVSQFDAYYRAGALVFGGGHVVLPLLESGVVGAGAVTAEQFLAGYGAVQAMPGPLFTFASYLGALSAQGLSGIPGALLATIAIFLPGFLFFLGVLPFWGRLKRYAWFRYSISGVNAAVVGILAATLYDPVFLTAVTSVWALGLAVICLVLLMWLRLPVWAVVLLGAAGGTLLEILT